MKQRCLYCYGELEEGQVDFHTSCSSDLFGSPTAPTYPFEPHISEAFSVKCGDNTFIPELQAVVMKLARGVLILTIPSSLLRTESGDMVYIAKTDKSAEGFDKIVESLDDCTFDGSAEMLAELVEAYSTISKLDIVTLFEHIIFGWITGCDSMSLSSFAISHPNDGVSSLAAAYDFIPDLNKDNDKISLSINGRNSAIRRSDFEAAMRFMGLKDRIIRITINKMIEAKELWFNTIENSPLNSDLKKTLIGKIESRLTILTK